MSINSSVESYFEQQLYRSNRDASLHTKFSLTIIHVPVFFLIVLGGRDAPDALDQSLVFLVLLGILALDVLETVENILKT